MDNEALLRQIEAAQPDILLVAFGNPKQEKWIAMHRHRLRVPVCIGVGGTFDFLAGVNARAPQWMQRSGLEWLHRLSQEPRRLWKRYTEDVIHFARLIGLQLWTMRRGGDPGESRILDTRTGDCTIVSVVGPLDERLLPEFQYVADAALNVPTHLILDLQATTALDSAALGTLLNLPKRAAYVEREVRLTGLNRRLRRILKVAETQDLFQTYSAIAEALRGERESRLAATLHCEEASATLCLRGRADAEAVSEVETRLREIPPSIRCVNIDLRAVSYIDSAMLCALRQFAETRRQAGGEARLAVGKAAQEMLARERLERLFTRIDAPP
jgi:N-acetylglucosaminyldiphosphoundecaprenol N-acetyl-beta-D-mannosaminyltransferase